MRSLPGALAAAVLILLSAAPGRPLSGKDGFLAAPYVLKAGAAGYAVHFGIEEDLHIATGLVGLGVLLPDVLVLADLASRGGASLESRRKLAFWTEMGAAAGLLAMMTFHMARRSRGDEVGLVYLAAALPILLLAQFNHIPFDAENGGAPQPSHQVLRISLPLP